MSTGTENQFENINNQGTPSPPPAALPPPTPPAPTPPPNSPSLGEMLGESPASPSVNMSPQSQPSISVSSNLYTPPPSPPLPMPVVSSPPTPAPAAAAPPKTRAASYIKKGMTSGQAALQKERLITLDMMREEYRKVFGDDKKAPKAKAYDAAGLTTVRLEQGTDAFLQKVRDEVLPRNIEVYEYKKTHKRPPPRGATRKQARPAPTPATPEPLSPSNNYNRNTRPSNLRAKAEELLRRAAALEEEQRQEAANNAAEQARREAVKQLRERAEANLRNAMGGQNVPKHLINGFMKLLQTEYKNVPAKAFTDICNFCSTHKTRRSHRSHRGGSRSRRSTRSRRSN